jgi:hypothetical protein
MVSEVDMTGRQPGFWDVEERLRELSVQGDPLEKQGRFMSLTDS